ncbi:MAG: DUF3592 domain-containing protein, partial [Burkholderiales bacterium]|nr:DUF3592 domain-containing protein [Burkholderiales bacterium]
MSKPVSLPAWIAIAAFGLLGLGASAVAVNFAWASLRFLVGGQTAIGEVVDVRGPAADRRDDGTRSPVIEFRTGDGRKARVLGLGRPEAEVVRGDAVQVLYFVEGDSVRWKEANFQSLWGAAAVFGVLGALFAVVAYIVWQLARGGAPELAVAGVFGALGVAVCIFGLVWLSQVARLVASGERGEGVVTRVVQQSSQRLTVTPSAVNPSGFRTVREGRHFIEIRYAPRGSEPVTVTASWFAVGRYPEGA